MALLGPLLGWSLLLPATAANAGADNSNVRAETPMTAPLAPGESAWVAVVWAADKTVTNWSTTVSAPAGVTVSYPTTRGGADTSLYGSATLVGKTRDFTAFRLAVPYSQRTSFPVTVTSTYTLCGDNGQCKNRGQRNESRTSSTTATVTVPVVPAVGPPFTQETIRVAIAAGSSDFQQISFTGGQTDLAAFSVRVGALPAGLEVAYPGDRAASTLNGGSTLVGRRTDHVGIRFAATSLPAGTYTVPLTISYTAASPVTTTGTVTLVVS
ncbi:hypothetical protein [Blastococcus saxobsidens]|uniref:Uncharacterized protein n=1 Tax=Blastococcus saxobsidens (strain DD2) TaxID=1146883 RepID=H6RP33_BLASD|nr:hypothetical protein [Blastococcus saxobsidens]CCG02694.1 protein of unknown function [Blastococcus saxobsidens DD2]